MDIEKLEPKKKVIKTIVSVNLSKEVNTKLDTLSKKLNLSKSELVNKLLEDALFNQLS